MKRRILVLILGVSLLLSGCGDIVNAAQALISTATLPPPTATATSTLTPTMTVTLTPTFTPTPLWVLQGPGAVVVPILLYHHVAIPPTKSRTYYVPPENFEAQMKLLRDWGYTSIPISLLAQAITEGAELPPRPIVIIFDDGNMDIYTNAFPVMQNYGFIGVTYIVSNRLQADGYVAAGQIQEMAAAGWEIGSHSRSHIDLSKNPDRLRIEIVDSRKDLEAALGVPVLTFAYPFGKMGGGDMDYVRFAGYTSAVGLGSTNDQGKGNLFYLQRRPINGNYDLKTFTLFLPWLGDPAFFPTETPTPTPTASRTPMP